MDLRTMGCGHQAFGVDDYDDDHRWRVRCRHCGRVERWTQGEWRGRLPVPPRGLVEVHDEEPEPELHLLLT